MAESIASDLAVKLLEHLGQVAVEQIAPYFGGRSKLKKLQQKMEVIQTRLIDAESQQEGERSALIKLWLKRLKSVLYELEDLFEEVSFADKEEEKDQRDHGQACKLIKLVRTLIFKCRGLQVNKNVSEQFQHIMMELEDIRSDMDDLNFRECAIDRQPLAFNLNSNRHTHSFIVEEDVIGREEDKKVIVEMLLNTNLGEDNVSTIPIIGIGGLGKTALAQLCFNDKNVQLQFELKAWACISEASSLEEIARVILKSITGCACDQLGIEEIQLRLREAIKDKTYLLVLDDVWHENRETWLQLRRLLSGGKPRSRIIVTSRSGVVAQNLGTVKAYELRGLPEDKSWALFKSLAFKDGQEERNPNFTSIGKEIVRKCANLPLAIRTVAGLLYCKDTEDEWVSFKDSELRRIDQHANGSNNIISTLKLTYDHLPSQLKQCFAYCSLFPKDHKINKQQLIWLWMAQGFVRPWGNQSPQDIGHAYFMELLRRCFFQDVQKDKFGRIESCKMHDLLHDLACEVGDECLTIGGSMKDIDVTIRHLSCNVSDKYVWRAPSRLLANSKQMRSLVLTAFRCPRVLNLNEVCSSLMCLRTLHLNNNYKSCYITSDDKLMYQSFLNGITELKHLRYLKLSVSSQSLPDCITRLHNLQVLDLRFSKKLTELPRRFSELLNLRHLQIGSKSLLDMPPRFGDLTSLQTLDVFVVGENNGLDALGNMSLTGELEVKFQKARQNAVLEAKMANMKGKKLDSLELDWSKLGGEEPGNNADEELESLQQSASLQELKVMSWKGVKFPLWGMDECPSLLPNLVGITIEDCGRCQQLPPFSRLPLLRSLHLSRFPKLEYMEDGVCPLKSSEAANTSASLPVFFPSLKDLGLKWFRELKGWWRMDDVQNQQHHQFLSQPEFPCLSELELTDCPRLMSMPMAPRLTRLLVTGVQGKLLHEVLMTGQEAGEASTLLLSSSTSSNLSELKGLRIHIVEGLEFLSINMASLESLCIRWCNELMSVNLESAASLRRLEIYSCSKLKEIVRGALQQQQLSLLERLTIVECKELEMGDGIDMNTSRVIWQGLQSLRGLRLTGLPKLESLPKGFCCPTTLKSIEISKLPNLRALPDSFCNLAQLQWLKIEKCPKLRSLPNSFLNNLTQLRDLHIYGECPELMSFLDSLDDLRCLKLLENLSISYCRNLIALPDWVSHLLHLRRIRIDECPKMSTLPDSFGNLTSLQSLEIFYCPELIRRCQQPDGDYCPLIQRIPQVHLI